jgi:hypothetical protein
MMTILICFVFLIAIVTLIDIASEEGGGGCAGLLALILAVMFLCWLL